MGGAANLPLTGLHAQLDRLGQHIWPARPRWVGFATGATGVAAMLGDLWVMRAAGRELPADGTTEQLRALYRQEAERLRAAAAPAPGPSPAPALPAPAAPPPSLYLASEGADPNSTEEGCVPCALGHEGAGQGMLERGADEAEAEGACGEACLGWLAPAAREYLALLRHDWTPGRLAAIPEWQQAAIATQMDAVQGLADDLVAGADPDPTRVGIRRAIVGADASIVEATRFTDTGDAITHPSVQRRLSSAEPDLLAGERRGATILPPALKAAVRANRQALLNSATTPEALRAVAAGAEAIDLEVLRPAIAPLTPAQVRALAQRAAGLRQGFKAALATAAPAPTPETPTPEKG